MTRFLIGTVCVFIATLSLAQTPTPTPSSASPSSTPTAMACRCLGDCNNDGQVTVDEIIFLINAALNNASQSCFCPPCAEGGFGCDNIDITVIQDAVINALEGCPFPPPTIAPTATPMPTRTPSPTLAPANDCTHLPNNYPCNGSWCSTPVVGICSSGYCWVIDTPCPPPATPTPIPRTPDTPTAIRSPSP